MSPGRGTAGGGVAVVAGTVVVAVAVSNQLVVAAGSGHRGGGIAGFAAGSLKLQKGGNSSLISDFL